MEHRDNDRFSQAQPRSHKSIKAPSPHAQRNTGAPGQAGAQTRGCLRKASAPVPRYDTHHDDPGGTAPDSLLDWGHCCLRCGTSYVMLGKSILGLHRTEWRQVTVPGGTRARTHMCLQHGTRSQYRCVSTSESLAWWGGEWVTSTRSWGCFSKDGSIKAAYWWLGDSQPALYMHMCMCVGLSISKRRGAQGFTCPSASTWGDRDPEAATGQEGVSEPSSWGKSHYTCVYVYSHLWTSILLNERLETGWGHWCCLRLCECWMCLSGLTYVSGHVCIYRSYNRAACSSPSPHS